MKTLQFAHISDTHFLKAYDSSGLMSGLVSGGATPTDSLSRLAQDILENCPGLAFVVASGDLVHEGKAEDYKAYRALLDKVFPGVPVYCCLGNHDRTAAFRTGFLGEAPCEGKAKEYYYTVNNPKSGLRLVVLDTSHDNSGTGMLSEEQLAWLQGELAVPVSGGRLLVLHHPPSVAMPEEFMSHGLVNSAALRDVIAGSDIMAILSGHTHQACAATFAGIPHITADSTAFGVKLSDQFMEMNDKVGYTLHTVQNGDVSAFVYQMPQAVKPGYKISMAQIMEMMKAHAQ